MLASSLAPPLMRRRRIERLNRELALLQQMDGKLNVKIIACAFATIFALAVGFLGFGIFLQVHLGPIAAVAICLILALFVYWVSLHEYGLASLALAIVFLWCWL